MKFKLFFSVTYQICQTMLFFLNLFIITEVTPLSCSSLTPALFENKGLFRRECHSVVLCSDCYAAHVFVCVQMWDRVTWGTADKRVVWLRTQGLWHWTGRLFFPFTLCLSHTFHISSLWWKQRLTFFFRPVPISAFKCFIIIKHFVIKYNEATVKAVSILYLALKACYAWWRYLRFFFYICVWQWSFQILSLLVYSGHSGHHCRVRL